jgi:hypothetical protein
VRAARRPNLSIRTPEIDLYSSSSSFRAPGKIFHAPRIMWEEKGRFDIIGAFAKSGRLLTPIL